MLRKFSKACENFIMDESEVNYDSRNILGKAQYLSLKILLFLIFLLGC